MTDQIAMCNPKIPLSIIQFAFRTHFWCDCTLLRYLRIYLFWGIFSSSMRPSSGRCFGLSWVCPHFEITFLVHASKVDSGNNCHYFPQTTTVLFFFLYFWTARKTSHVMHGTSEYGRSSCSLFVCKYLYC